MKIGHKEKEMLVFIPDENILVSFLLSAGSSSRLRNGGRFVTRSSYERANEKRNQKNIIKKLAKKNLIEWKDSKDGPLVRLSKLGKQILQKEAIIETTRNTRHKWDGKWHIIMFDVPNEFSTHRIELRDILRRAGFQKIQKSSYAFPYNVSGLINYINKHPYLKHYCQYLVGEFQGDDSKLRKKFGL